MRKQKTSPSPRKKQQKSPRKQQQLNERKRGNANPIKPKSSIASPSNSLVINNNTQRWGHKELANLNVSIFDLINYKIVEHF